MVVAKKFGGLYVSASSLRLLADCPRGWFYRYMLGAPSEDLAARMVLGSACHAAAAHFYTALRDGCPEPSVDEMWAIATKSISEAASGPIPLLFDGEQDVDGLISEAGRLLAAFAAQGHRPKRVVGVEKSFCVPLGHHPETGEVVDTEESIAGVLDLVTEDDDGSIGIVDHKFRKRSEPEGTLDLQMALYALVAQTVFPSAHNARLFHQNVIGTKVAKVELRELPLRDQDLAEAFESIASGVTLIHAAIGHPNPRRLLGRRRGWMCSACDHRTRCATDRG